MGDDKAIRWGALKGGTILDGETDPRFVVTAQEGFSTFGRQVARLTDHPALYLYDSGGVFGQEGVARLDRDLPDKAHFETGLRDGKPYLAVRARFGKGKTCTAEARGGDMHPAIDAVWRLGEAVAPRREADLITPMAVLARWTRADPDTGAPSEEECQAHLALQGGDLIAQPAGKSQWSWVTWALAGAEIRATDATAIAVGGSGALLDGPRDEGRPARIDGASFVFPYRAYRDAFLAAARRAVTGESGEAGAAKAATVPVDVEGGRFGGRIRHDAAITAAALEFRAGDAAVASVGFADPQLRISGTPERFIVYTPGLGPVAVRFPDSARRRATRLLEHPDVAAAAARTLRDGPFPITLLPDAAPDGIAAIAEAGDGALRLLSSQGEAALPVSTLRSLKPDFRGGRTRLEAVFEGDAPPVRLEGPTQLVEALHTAIRAESLAAAPADRIGDLLKAAVAAEEEYFLSAVFAPCYELHATLLSPDWTKTGSADLSRAVIVPAGEEAGDRQARDRIAALFAGGLDQLRRHFDRVLHVLPPFVRQMDAQVAVGGGAAEPAWLKRQEAELRRILALLAPASGEIAQLSAQAARISDFDPSRVKQDYGSAMLSLGVGAFINPAFLIGAAGQAYSQHSAGEKQRAQMTDQAQRSLRALALRWNGVVAELLPMLSYSLTEALFPHRVATARELAASLAAGDEAARATGLRRVARRLARLDVRRRYPVVPLDAAPDAGAAAPLTRGDLVAHIKRAREPLGSAVFAEF